MKMKIKIEKQKSKLKIDFYFWKKLLTNRNQCDILIIETKKTKSKRRIDMRILVTNIDTLEEIFEGDAEDFLADNSYDEDIEFALCTLD